MAEVDVAAPLVPWLREMEWDVHQEVSISTGGRRADIVAVRGPLVWVIEVKQRGGLALLEQGFNWVGFAHYVSIAAPRFARSVAMEMFCRDHGIGMLSVCAGEISERIAPRLYRKALDHWLRSAICEETRTWAQAGNAMSDYFSPFRRTVRRIHDVLRAEPGLTMKELMARVDHHYASAASARGAIHQWIRLGKIKGLRSDGGHPGRWYLEAERVVVLQPTENA